MAKGGLDVEWSMLRNELRYTCDCAGAPYNEVDEAETTQPILSAEASAVREGRKD